MSPQPLKWAKLPSPCRKKRSIGIIRSIADRRMREGCDAARRERLAKRQEVHQQFEDCRRVAADMAAVGEDLADEFEVEPLARLLEEALLLRHRQRRRGQRDHDAEPRQPLRTVIGGAPQVADLPGQRLHEAAVEVDVAAVEDERRLVEPGDHPARHHAGLPCHRLGTAGGSDPLVDQAPRVGARDRHVGGAEMAEPAEAVQFPRPLLGRRLGVEDRMPSASTPVPEKTKRPA